MAEKVAAKVATIIHGPAPRTYLEHIALFNPFNTWVVAFTVIDERCAVKPEEWPRYWWWWCECGQHNGRF